MCSSLEKAQYGVKLAENHLCVVQEISKRRFPKGIRSNSGLLRPTVRMRLFSAHTLQQHVSGNIRLERNIVMLIHIFEVLVAATALLLSLILLLWRIQSTVEFLEERIPMVFRSLETKHWRLRPQGCPKEAQSSRARRRTPK